MSARRSPTFYTDHVGAPGHCDRCGEPIHRATGARGPLPRRCPTCRGSLERRIRLRSRIRECVAIAQTIGHARIERQLRNIGLELDADAS